VKEAKTVMLVEDEAIIAMAQKAVLTRSGYQVMCARNGEEAVNTASITPEIDLVLMDIDLGGGMNGTDAAEIILSHRELPLVFLSSHTEPEVVAQTEGITSYGYIVKNSGETVLLASIRMAFRLFEEKQAVRKQKMLLDGVFHSIQDGMSVLDSNLIIQHVNHAMEKWYPDTEGLVGRSCHSVYHHSAEICSFCPSVRALKSGKVESAIVPARPDSPLQWLELYAYPMKDTLSGQITGVVEFVRDISAQKRNEAQLKIETSRLQLLLRVGEALSSLPKISEIMPILAETATNLMEMDTATIYLLVGDEIYLEAATPPLPPEFPEELRRAKLNEHPHIHTTMTERSTLVIPDYLEAELTEEEQKAAEMRSLRTIVMVPLVGHGGVLGVLIVATTAEVREVSEDQLSHCQTVATQASLAIENARLHESLQNQVLDNVQGQ